MTSMRIVWEPKYKTGCGCVEQSIESLGRGTQASGSPPAQPVRYCETLPCTVKQQSRLFPAGQLRIGSESASTVHRVPSHLAAWWTVIDVSKSVHVKVRVGLILFCGMAGSSPHEVETTEITANIRTRLATQLLVAAFI